MIYILLLLISIVFAIFTNIYTGILLFILLVFIVIYYESKLGKLYVSSSQKVLIAENEKDLLLVEVNNLKAILDGFDNIEVGIVLVDDNGVIIYNNNHFLKQFDLSNLEIDDAVLKAIFNRAIVSNEFNYTYLIANKYFEVQVKTLAFANYKEMHSIQFYDVTSLKTMNLMQRKFLIDTSHELRNPLAAIIMAKDVLKREVNNDFITIIEEESNRLKYLIDDLFELAQLESSYTYEFEQFNLSQLCNKYSLKYSGDKRFILSVDNSIEIYGNYGLIDRLIQNLVDNAFKYSDDGYIKLSLRSFNNEVILKVSDNGIGIDNNDLEKIFDRFYRVDNSRTRSTGGSGLGLSIVNEIVNIHNASMDVESKIGIGTTFIIKFKGEDNNV